MQQIDVVGPPTSPPALLENHCRYVERPSIHRSTDSPRPTTCDFSLFQAVPVSAGYDLTRYGMDIPEEHGVALYCIRHSKPDFGPHSMSWAHNDLLHSCTSQCISSLTTLPRTTGDSSPLSPARRTLLTGASPRDTTSIDKVEHYPLHSLLSPHLLYEWWGTSVLHAHKHSSSLPLVADPASGRLDSEFGKDGCRMSRHRRRLFTIIGAISDFKMWFCLPSASQRHCKQTVGLHILTRLASPPHHRGDKTACTRRCHMFREAYAKLFCRNPSKSLQIAITTRRLPMMRLRMDVGSRLHSHQGQPELTFNMRKTAVTIAYLAAGQPALHCLM